MDAQLRGQRSRAGLHRAAGGDDAAVRAAHRAGARRRDRKGRRGETARRQFNDTLNAQVEGTRDYIVTHFKTNTRTDTEYWRANAANTHLSAPLQQLLRTWLSSHPITGGIAKGAFGRGYPIMSWYSLLAGVGLFPAETRTPTAQEARYSLAEVDSLLDRSALNFPDHRAFLKAIPPKPRDPSLQVYFW